MWHEPELAESRPAVTGFPMELGPEMGRKRKRAQDDLVVSSRYDKSDTKSGQAQNGLGSGSGHSVSPAPDASEVARLKVEKDLSRSLVTNVTDEVTHSSDTRRRRSGRHTTPINYYQHARVALGLESPGSSPSSKSAVSKDAKSRSTSPELPTTPKRATRLTSSVDGDIPTKIRITAVAADSPRISTPFGSPKRQSLRILASSPIPDKEKTDPDGGESPHRRRSERQLRETPEPGSPRKGPIIKDAVLAKSRQSQRFSAPGAINGDARSSIGHEKGSTHTHINQSGSGAGVREKSAEASSVNANGHENQDWCSSCGGTGRFLCCENCPKSFHFVCVDPPVDENTLPEGAWFCKQCGAKLHPPTPWRRSIFGELLNQLDKRNPRQFRLPQGIRNRFEGVSMDERGDYVDETKLPPKKQRDADEFVKLEDNNGDTILCFKCSKSALSGPMATCSRCASPWHADCLDEPLYSIPNHWVCPNHPEKAAKLPRRLRKPHVVDATLKRGQQNNGYIEVQDDSDYEDQVRDIPFFGLRDTPNGVAAPIPKQRLKYMEGSDGVVYRLPARSIKLDFIDLIHQRAKEPYIQTPTSQLLVALDELATKPQEDREAVRDLFCLKLDEDASGSTAIARRNIDLLIDAAIKGSNEVQTTALLRLIEIKGREKLLDFLTSD